MAVAATIVACGGDDDGGNGGGSAVIDASMVLVDAPPPDMAAAMGIGQPCTPSQDGSGQGSCPAGFTCLSLGGTNGAWCSKTCMRGSGDQCNAGYPGPGIAGCIFNITFGSGTTPIPYCGVVCADTTGTCGAPCSGACPGALTCSRALMNGSGMTVGSACF